MKIQPVQSGSKGNCYILESNGSLLILECGIPMRDIRAALNHRLHQVAGCLITHEHKDHSRSAAGISRLGVHCYASGGTIAQLKLDDTMRFHAVTEESFRIDNWQVTSFPAVHDAAEPLNYYIVAPDGERLLFVTDNSYWNVVHRPILRFEAAEYYLVEANYDTRLLEHNYRQALIPEELRRLIPLNHLSLTGCIRCLKQQDLSKLKAVYLIHLSSLNSNAEEFKRRVQRIFGVETFVV